jgi:isopentenyl-diphosphate delta-isomerase
MVQEALKMTGTVRTQNRKEEHVAICLDRRVQHGRRFWEDVHLVHNALPEVDMNEIDLSARLFGKRLEAPIIIAAMTGGYPGAERINRNLAEAAARCGVGLGLGSQRAALERPSLARTFSVVKRFDVPLVMGNIGAPQLIDQKGRAAFSLKEVMRAKEMVGAHVMAVHLNFLQEVAEWDGDTQSRGCLRAISSLSSRIPVVVKETGAGISRDVAQRILGTRAAGLDVGGAGGTTFAGVEVHRARKHGDRMSERLGNTFWDWGIPAPVSVIEVRELDRLFPVIATGGVRSGLDCARAIALGASAAGAAAPMLRPAMKSAKAVEDEIEMLKAELRAAMFLTGSADIAALAKARTVVTGRCAQWLGRN